MDDGPGVNPPQAGLARRVGSLVYETLVVAALVLVAGFAIVPVMSPSAAPAAPLVVPSEPGRIAGAVVLIAVLGAYFTWCWTGGRRTLPMKTWRLALVDEEGQRLRRGRALTRYATAWAGPALAVGLVAATHSRYGWLALALPYAWALVDPDHRFLHDRLAGTRLVDEIRGQTRVFDAPVRDGGS